MACQATWRRFSFRFEAPNSAGAAVAEGGVQPDAVVPADVVPTMARQVAARVGQAWVLMSPPFSEEKKLPATALYQHWRVRPRNSTTYRNPWP